MGVSCVLGGLRGRHPTWDIWAIIKVKVVPPRKGDPINKTLQCKPPLGEAFKSWRGWVRTGSLTSETIWKSLENPLWEIHGHEPIREPAFVFLPWSVTVTKTANTNRGRAASLSGREWHILNFPSLFLAPTQKKLSLKEMPELYTTPAATHPPPTILQVKKHCGRVEHKRLEFYNVFDYWITKSDFYNIQWCKMIESGQDVLWKLIIDQLLEKMYYHVIV